MRYLILLAACAACAASAAPPADTAYPPTCRMPNERCVGADQRPAVVWRPCCAGYVCEGADASPGGYGLVCVPPTCRLEGARCRGAKGRPLVQWIPCCDGMSCGGVHAEGWGEKCFYPTLSEVGEGQVQAMGAKGAGEVPEQALEKVPKIQIGEALPTEAPAVVMDMSKLPKCWANGERCGDSLKQPWEAVKCCSGACDEPASDYGMQCSDGKLSLAKEEDCSQAGDQCRSGADCCGDFACEYMGGTFMVCVKPKKCAVRGGLCFKDGDCCGEASCVDAGKGYVKELRCKVVEKNECVKDEGECKGESDCCEGFKCIGTYGKYRFAKACVKIARGS